MKNYKFFSCNTFSVAFHDISKFCFHCSRLEYWVLKAIIPRRMLTMSESFQRKSVSAEVNYGIRFTCQNDAHKFISELAAEVENRLVAIKMKGKCITLKLKVSYWKLTENLTLHVALLVRYQGCTQAWMCIDHPYTSNIGAVNILSGFEKITMLEMI